MQTQLTAADPDEIDPELLRAIVFATGATAKIDPPVFEAVHQAWRERRRLRLRYEGGHDPADTAREIDVHALFLSQGAWYARVFCHLRNAHRSLAIHRMTHPELLNATFRRDESVLADVRRGHVFDYAKVRSVVIECSPEKAQVIGEREWFPGQRLERLADGRLRLTFPDAPRPELVWWVMSYCGNLVVRGPQDLVEEVRARSDIRGTEPVPPLYSDVTPAPAAMHDPDSGWLSQDEEGSPR